MTGHSVEHAGSGSPRLEQVSGVYAYVQPDGSWFLNNCGFVVGPGGVIVIDASSTERRTRAFQAALRGTTDRPVQALVNTHMHGDHTNGNYLFAPAAIIAQERCRQEMLATGVYPEALTRHFDGLDFSGVELAPPFVTFESRLNVYAGDLRLELIHPGTPAHTTNDVVVWLPERRLLFSGDLVFNGGTPLAVGGSIAGWLEALDLMRGLGAERVIPGHGPVCDPSAFDAIEAYLCFVQEAASDMENRGAEPLEYARGLDLGAFASLTDPERIVANLHRARSELRGEPRGAPLPLLRAVEEMVAYNGGRPLTCYA